MPEVCSLEELLPRDGVGDRALDQVRLELGCLDIGKVTVYDIWKKNVRDEFDLGGSFPARIMVMDHGLSVKAKTVRWTPVLLFVAEAAYQARQQG